MRSKATMARVPDRHHVASRRTQVSAVYWLPDRGGGGNGEAMNGKAKRLLKDIMHRNLFICEIVTG